MISIETIQLPVSRRLFLQLNNRRTCRGLTASDVSLEPVRIAGNTEAEALKETGAINKSLFTLGQVLKSLSSRSRGARPPIPYRDSTLTKLLWDNLQGSARTLMLACVNPLASQAEQTAHTLHFASMALRISTKPVIRQDPHDQVSASE